MGASIYCMKAMLLLLPAMCLLSCATLRNPEFQRTLTEIAARAAAEAATQAALSYAQNRGGRK